MVQTRNVPTWECWSKVHSAHALQATSEIPQQKNASSFHRVLRALATAEPLALTFQRKSSLVPVRKASLVTGSLATVSF